MRRYRDRQRSLDQLALHLNVWAEELSTWETGRREQVGAFDLTAPDGSRHRIDLGQAWPDRHGIYRFRSVHPVRGATEGEAVELRLDLGGEALVRLKDASGAVLDSFGANPRHRRFSPIPPVPFHIEAEVAARTLMGVPNRDPRVSLAELAKFEPSLRALRRRIEVIRDTMDVAGSDDLARRLYDVAAGAISFLRLPTRTDDVGPRLARTGWAEGIWERSFEPSDDPAPLDAMALDSITMALARLDQGLADLRRAWPKMGRVLTTGHAHIDYAWLWPQPETVRKIVRTFHSVASLMRSHPDFTFLASSSLHYAHVEDEDPDLLSEIKARVAEGRWEVAGGMLIESDTNMPSAEAFVRQFLQGQQYFRDRFGVTCRTAWLPDTFGFTGAMPQILRHCGLDAMVTIKVTWNETNEMPDNLFRWIGNDGSEVLVHTYNARRNDGYNMKMTPAALVEVWGNHKAQDLTDTVISSYGWGDGGGGPDPDQIEIMPVLNLMPRIPEVFHGSVQGQIDRIRGQLDVRTLPAWTGEMYFEYHRATLTTQGRTKRLNRRAELALVAAEATAGIANLAGIATEASNSLASDWTLMLRNQFHDILPGSSIREVYVQTEEELSGIVDRAEAQTIRNLAAIARSRAEAGSEEGILVANLSGSAKERWQLEQRQPLPAWLSPQRLRDMWVATADRRLAPLSVAFLAGAKAVADGVRVVDRTMENAQVSVALDESGRIVSLFDKRSGRELIDGTGNRLMIYRNDLPRKYDAWDIEPGFAQGGEELVDLEGLSVTASGPHLGEITIVRPIGASRITQRLRLWANSPRLDIVTDLDWHDRRTYLRAEVPVTVLADHAEFDQAIGITRRATHDNTSWQRAQFEGCGHRFASLSETGWGAALLSADKYGFSAKGNVLTLSLVRGPMYPDMLADEGAHRFTYAILPHDGRWWGPDLQAEADLLNDPLRAVRATGSADWDLAPVTWDREGMRFHALKPAEDGDGLILRLSEAAGSRGPLRLSVPDGRSAGFADGLERPVERVEAVDPFTLLSVRIAGSENH